MESKDSVRNRLRATSFEADDRALLDEQIADARSARQIAAYEPSANRRGSVGRSSTMARSVFDIALDAISKAAYRVDDAVRYVRARPITALVVAAGVGAVVTSVLLERRSRR